MVRFGVFAETLRPAPQPQVELVFERAHVGDQLVLKPLGIVHQVARMHFEKSCQQHARRIGKVRTRAALDLREVALADGLSQLFLDQPGHLELRELTVEPAERAFHFAEVAELFAELHMAICDYYIANCDGCQEKKGGEKKGGEISRY